MGGVCWAEPCLAPLVIPGAGPVANLDICKWA
jgi:hypothetical protein